MCLRSRRCRPDKGVPGGGGETAGSSSLSLPIWQQAPDVFAHHRRIIEALPITMLVAGVPTFEGAPALIEEVEEAAGDAQWSDGGDAAGEPAEEDRMKKSDRPPRWERPLDPDEDGDSWFDDEEERAASLDRRRHRDSEETDERRESERRSHPRQPGRERE